MPVTNNYSIREEYILALIELYSDSKARKTSLTYYNPNTDEFTGLQGSTEDFLDYCLSGVPKKKDNPSKSLFLI